MLFSSIFVTYGQNSFPKYALSLTQTAFVKHCDLTTQNIEIR